MGNEEREMRYGGEWGTLTGGLLLNTLNVCYPTCNPISGGLSPRWVLTHMRITPVSTNVALLLRVRASNGSWTYAKPAYAANNRLKPLYAIIDGKQEHHPEGAYYIRFAVHRRRHMKRAGFDPAEAMACLKRQEYLLKGLAMGIESPELPQPPPPPDPDIHRQRWKDAVHVYMLEVEAPRGTRTASGYSYTLESFGSVCPVTFLDEITREHILAFEAAIRRKGNTARTAYNRIAELGTFLRYWKLPDIVSRKDLPRYTKKKAVVYQLGDLAALFSAATESNRLLFEFFLGSGCREQEVMYMTAQDIDFENRLVHIRAKPEWKWEPKDKEERPIPVPDDLLAKLKTHIATGPADQRLLFPSAKNRKKPDKHLLRRLKVSAFQSGLNCGHCVAKNGKRCADHPVCKRWSQHAFRRTFATIHHRNGVSVRTLMDWLGHSDLATVQLYLASEDTQSDATRQAVNSSFIAVGM